MKALLILFGVAGAVLAILLVGGLSRPERSALPAPTRGPAETNAVELAIVDAGQWARFRRQADGICAQAHRDVQRQMDRIRLATVPEQVISSLDRTVGIQRRTVTKLTRVKRPVGLGSRIEKFLAVFRAQLADDRRIVGSLKARTLTLAQVERALRRETRRVARVTALSNELGITACGRYVDYDFYE